MWKQTQHLSSDYFLGLSRFLNINCKFVPIFPYRWQCKAWLRPQCCRWNGTVSLTGESEVLAIHQYIQHVWSSGHGQGASDWNGDRGKTGWLSTFERTISYVSSVKQNCIQTMTQPVSMVVWTLSRAAFPVILTTTLALFLSCFVWPRFYHQQQPATPTLYNSTCANLCMYNKQCSQLYQSLLGSVAVSMCADNFFFALHL